MPHSFLAFIDESGDDGFGNYREPGKSGGASHWLVLSACIVRKTNSLEMVGWRDEIMQKIQKDKGYLHFVKLDHSQRIVAAQCLSEKPLRIITVFASKKLMKTELFRKKNQLYFYLTRYLIERISWFCRDYRSMVKEGNGQVAITFSRRGGMSYENFKSYLYLLKSDQSDAQIHWPAIDIDTVNAQDHSRTAALQLVDIAASSFSAAVEYNRYGHCEDRYAQILKPIVYKRKGSSIGYGLKFVPRLEDCALSPQQEHLIDWYK